MKRTFIASLLLSTSLAGLVGCASDQGQSDAANKPAAQKPPEEKKDTRPLEQRLSVGMTKDEVRKALGDPGGTYVTSDGVECWTYSDRAKAFIPFYSISGGKFQNLTINFDKDGKVKSWASGTTGAY